MNLSLSSLILYVGFSLISGMIVFIARDVMNRINDLEVRVRQAVNETQVRQFISDKFEPIEESLKEVKENQIKLLDLYMETLKGNKQ